jgi:hypothetical protein
MKFSLGTVAMAATMVAGLTSVSLAQPAMQYHAPALPGASLLRVSTCNPQLSAPPVYGGFSPGFYPGGFYGRPYYWNDPYGFNYYQAPITAASATLQIDYTNIGTLTMKEIQFGLVARGHLVAEVRDVGKFSPHAEIKHSFGISRNVFPLQTAIVNCVPLHIVFDNGTQWTNPRLPQIEPKIYN